MTQESSTQDAAAADDSPAEAELLSIELRRLKRALRAIRKEVTDPGAQDPDVWHPIFLRGWHTIADHIVLILRSYDFPDEEES